MAVRRQTADARTPAAGTGLGGAAATRGRPEASPSLHQEAWYTSDVFALGKQFFYETGNDPDAMLGQARMMIILLSLVLGVAVFWWAKRLWGTAGGYVALVLYTFSPTMLANGRLVTTDLAVSLFFLLSVGGVWWVLHRVSLASVLLGAVALAGLFLSKMSAALIVPMGLVLAAVRLVSGRPLLVKIGRERLVTRRWQMALVFTSVMVFFVLADGAGVVGNVRFSLRRDDRRRSRTRPLLHPGSPAGRANRLGTHGPPHRHHGARHRVGPAPGACCRSPICTGSSSRSRVRADGRPFWTEIGV